jgi:phosphoglycerol transferase MdoB-like AlkP superfamily enzyme
MSLPIAPVRRGELVKTLTSAVRADPVALALLALVALGAGMATRAGTLPGQLPRISGPVAEGLAWTCLFVGLGLAYRAVSEQASAPGVPRRIGACLLLALATTHLCQLLATTLVSPWTWEQLFYLKRLVPPASVAFWCGVLLPRETRALVRAATTSPRIAPLPQLVVLLASAAILISCGDLAFEWSGATAQGAALKGEIIYREAWTANVLMLFSAYALVFAASSRVLAALLVVSPVYAVLGIATLMKIRYMHAAVQPLDVMRTGEFLPFFRGTFGTGVLAATVALLGLWIGALLVVRKIKPSPTSPGRRWSTGLLSLAVVLVFPVAFYHESSVPDDVENSLPPADALLSRFRLRGREFKEMARLRGFLMSFVAELPAAFVATPSGYSPAGVATAVGRYCRPGVAAGRQGGVNLILYMVESFMDPEDLGLHFTSDPIPTVRALRRTHIGGYGIVPEEFGGSANTEFEALTGMATSFLPEGSVAYRFYLRQPIPSLPSLLRGLGYVTTAVQADPKHFYDRERAYRLLGFDSVVWLGDTPGTERAPRGWWPSDRAVAEAVIAASRRSHPAFVFAFPSSTHFPYNQGTYRNSDLDVLDVPSKDAAGEVKEYVNTLRVADQAIAMLVEYFRRQPDSTVIAVLGDHLPPLPEGALRTFFSNLSGLSGLERARMRRRVPLLVWANFALPHEETEMSINALPSYLLEKIGVAPSGFLAVSDAVRRRVPVLASYAQGADGRIGSQDSLPGDDRRLVEDYRLLQHDLLVGKQYSLRHDNLKSGSCRGDM